MLSINKFNNYNIQFKAKPQNTNAIKDNTKSTAIYRGNNVSYFYYYPENNTIEDNESPVISSTFRDDELFDEKRDYITEGYRSYDEDDIKPIRQFKDIVDSDYRMDRDCGLTSKVPDEKTVYNKEKTKKTNYNIYLPHQKNEFQTVLFDRYPLPVMRNKIIEACLITKNGDKKLSKTLTNSFIQNNSQYSASEMIDIFNVSKMKKANGDEVVDETALSNAYKDLNRFPANGNNEMKTIINLSKSRDNKGNEVFSPYRHACVINLIEKKRESFKDLPLLMDVMTTSKPSSSFSHIDSKPYEFLHKLRGRGMTTQDAADITNACKLKGKDNNSYMNKDLENIAIKDLLAKSYKPSTVAPVLNNLKTDNPDGSEKINLGAVKLLHVLIDRCKSDEAVLKYMDFCNAKDIEGNRYFNNNRAQAIINAQAQE